MTYATARRLYLRVNAMRLKLERLSEGTFIPGPVRRGMKALSTDLHMLENEFAEMSEPVDINAPLAEEIMEREERS